MHQDIGARAIERARAAVAEEAVGADPEAEGRAGDVLERTAERALRLGGDPAGDGDPLEAVAERSEALGGTCVELIRALEGVVDARVTAEGAVLEVPFGLDPDLRERGDRADGERPLGEGAVAGAGHRRAREGGARARDHLERARRRDAGPRLVDARRPSSSPASSVEMANRTSPATSPRSPARTRRSRKPSRSALSPAWLSASFPHVGCGLQREQRDRRDLQGPSATRAPLPEARRQEVAAVAARGRRRRGRWRLARPRLPRGRARPSGGAAAPSGAPAASTLLPRVARDRDRGGGLLCRGRLDARAVAAASRTAAPPASERGASWIQVS